MKKTPASESEKALRWLNANRRPDVSNEQTVSVMCHALHRDLATMQILRRIAEEEEAKQPASKLNWRTPPGLPPRG